MAQMLSVQKSKKSKMKRLSLLPRVGLTIDFMGREINYKYAPVIETLFNTWKSGAGISKMMKVSIEQFQEINFHEHSIDEKSYRAKKAKTKKKRL